MRKIPSLNAAQKALAVKHGILHSQVLDARGLTFKERKAALAAGSYLAAVHGRECCANGHTTDLWSTSGHCVVCHPQNVQMQKKHSASGLVYIACSARTKLTKIGITEDEIDCRIGYLRSQSYAGTDDWKLYFCASAHEIGKVEGALKLQLQVFKVPTPQLRALEWKTSHEVFSCLPSKAKRELQKLLDKQPIHRRRPSSPET